MECFGDEAPHTVENIIRLVKGGFYSGISFHRVALNHVIQSGDPHGDGWGGSLPLIKSEISRLSYDEPGMVGIADRGKDTGSSQFFITLTPATISTAGTLSLPVSLLEWMLWKKLSRGTLSFQLVS